MVVCGEHITLECGPGLPCVCIWPLKGLHAQISQLAGFKGHLACTEITLNTQTNPAPSPFSFLSSEIQFFFCSNFQTQELTFDLFQPLKPIDEQTDFWSVFPPSLMHVCRLYLVSWVGPDQCSSSSSCSDHDFISTINRTDTCGESHSEPAAAEGREREPKLKQREE